MTLRQRWHYWKSSWYAEVRVRVIAHVRAML